MRAGARAHKLYALQEATEHYQEALRRIEKGPADQTVEQRQIVHAALGELLTIASQYEQAVPHLDQALALASARDDADAQAHACRWLARLHELRGEYAPALDWVERGLAVLAGRETSEAAEMLLISGLVYTRQGEYDNALAYCTRALHIAEKLNVAPALARAHNMLGHIARLHGDRIAAIEQFRRAFDLHQRTGDLHGQATMYNQIAMPISTWANGARRNKTMSTRAPSLIKSVTCTIAQSPITTWAGFCVTKAARAKR